MLRVNCVESNKYFNEYLESKGFEPLSPEALEDWETELELEELAQKQEELAEISPKIEVEEEEMDLIEPIVLEEEKPQKRPRLEAETCRLCLASFPKGLPEENGLVFMKSMLKKVMTLKKFTRTMQAPVPDKFCDDCIGKLITASSVAEKCVAAYDFLHSGESVVITTATCWVCLKDFQNESGICEMSSMTYSYMHFLATRNSVREQSELEGDRKICLKCMHDLEVANAIRYKNWKTENALDLQFGKAVKTGNSPGRPFDPWYVDEDSDEKVLSGRRIL